MQKVFILPSLLAGDFGNLESSALRAQEAGADALHMDIMDGHFVPNISMGPDVVKMAHRCLHIPLNVHLMLTKPDDHIRSFIEAGAHTVLIHIESQCDVVKTLRLIRELGARPGLALNPETPAKTIISLLPEVDEVLCMTVHPGFGGQAFMPEVLPKISEIRQQWLVLQQKRGRGDKKSSDTNDAGHGVTNPNFMLAVDGGINLETVMQIAEAGANGIIAGNSLFTSSAMARDIELMREKAEKALAKGSKGLISA